MNSSKDPRIPLTGRPSDHDPVQDERTNPSRKGLNGLIKSKTDWIWFGVIALVLIGMLMIWGSTVRGNRADDSPSEIKITNAQKTQVDDTVRRFITTAGTFGFDWTQVDDPGKQTFIQNVRDEWLRNIDTSDSIKPEIAQAIQPRDLVMLSLTQPSDGSNSLITTSSEMYKPKFEYATLADAFYASQFSVNPDTVKVNWKGATIKDKGNGIKQADVQVSWDSVWKRVTVIPQDNGSGGKILMSDKWEPRSTTEEFRNVRMTLQTTPDGKAWQVIKMSDGGNNDWNRYGWMLAVGMDAKYDENGRLVTTANSGNTVNDSTSDDESNDE